MAYRKVIFANEEIYHVFNRGVEKRIIFENDRDFNRFVDTLNYYRLANPPVRFSFSKRPSTLKENKKQAVLVQALCYCLMPNHFHLLLKQTKENGISKFLSQISNSYTKYFNTKNERVGPLFQGTFKAVRIKNGEQLIHTSRYIHLNPLVGGVIADLKKFPFSSYVEYLQIKNGFCSKETVMSHFADLKDYEKFTLDQKDYVMRLNQIEKLMLE